MSNINSAEVPDGFQYSNEKPRDGFYPFKFENIVSSPKKEENAITDIAEALAEPMPVEVSEDKLGFKEGIEEEAKLLRGEVQGEAFSDREVFETEEDAEEDNDGNEGEHSSDYEETAVDEVEEEVLADNNIDTEIETKIEAVEEDDLEEDGGEVEGETLPEMEAVEVEEDALPEDWIGAEEESNGDEEEHSSDYEEISVDKVEEEVLADNNIDTEIETEIEEDGGEVEETLPEMEAVEEEDLPGDWIEAEELEEASFLEISDEEESEDLESKGVEEDEETDADIEAKEEKAVEEEDVEIKEIGYRKEVLMPLLDSELSVDELIDLSEESKKANDMIAAMDYLLIAFTKTDSVEIKTILCGNLVFHYKDIGKYTEAKQFIESFLDNNYQYLNSSTIDHFRHLIVYLDSLDKLLDKAGQAGLPFSRVPKIIKIMAEKAFKNK